MTSSGPFFGTRPTRRLVILSLARILLAIVLVLGIYAVLPDTPNSKLENWLIVVAGVVVFLLVLYWQVREVTQSPRPVLRATEALAICVTLFLTLFASQYVAESLAAGSAFSQPLDKFSALYYTTTVFSTVGFGDITPVSDVARALTMAQMIGNIIVLGVGFRILTSVAREGLERKRIAAASPPAPPQR